MSESANCCRCCVSFILSAGLTALFLWLSLHPSSPTFFIQNFSVPALNTSAKSTTATNVSIDFRIENSNKFKGIYYDTLNVTLYYSPNLTFPVGDTSIPGFYQGYKKKATKGATLQKVKIPWRSAVKTVLSNGTVRFRVDLETTVRYKIVGRKTGRHQMRVHDDVIVDKQGKQINKKSIKLKSAAPGGSGGCHRHWFFRIMALLFVLLSSDPFQLP